MEAQLESRRNGSRAYITPDKAAIDGARKSATKKLLSTFEELIEPLVPPGHEKAVTTFKGVCRKKINRLAYEALRAAESGPNDVSSPLSADLAEDFAFDRED